MNVEVEVSLFPDTAPRGAALNSKPNAKTKSAPIPSPAPDRLIYVLKPGDQGGVTCHFRCPGGFSYGGARDFRDKDALGRFMNRPYLTKDDRRILMRLYMARFGVQGDEFELAGAAAFAVAKEMVETGRAVWDLDGEALRWRSEPWKGTLGWKLTGAEMHRPDLELDVTGDDADAGEHFIIPGAPLLAVHPEIRQVAPISCGAPDGLASAWLNAKPMSTEEATVFAGRLQARFPEHRTPMPPSVRKRVRDDVQPAPWLNIRLREFFPTQFGGERLSLYVGELSFDYLGQRIRHGAAVETVTHVENGELVEVKRDLAFEAQEVATLVQLGLAPLKDAVRGYELEDAGETFVSAQIDQVPWFQVLAAAQAGLEARGWNFRFEGLRQLAAASDAESYFELGPSTEKPGWFEVETGLAVNGRRVNILPLLHGLLQQYQGWKPSEIRAALEPRSFFVPTLTGLTHVFDGKRFASIVERVFELYDRSPFSSGERLRLSALRAAELAESFGMKEEIPGIPDNVRRIVEILRDGVTLVPAEEPAGLQAKLRDYQKLGLGWLQFLAENEVNGVLADDMGLGKTIQTISHLLAEKHAGRLDKPAMLVVPTSLLRNWKDETEKFAPELRIVTLYGNDRAILFRTFENVDLVITTYGLIRRDAARHMEQAYSWVILDEAQFIKNPKSKVTEVLRGLNCQRRLCLTGTPMENHLGELWSLFHFLMPGFLGDAEMFKRQFRMPIELDGNEAMRDVLMRRVRPFLLRRKKNEVVKELPPKTEILHPVEMTDKQWDIYESVRVAMHRRVQAEIAERGLARSQIVILDAITKLRQICCDPRLAKLSGTENLTREHSAKLTELMDMIPEMLSQGNRILVFSQFTSMLSLIGAELQAAEINFVKLTGQTKDRGQVVDQFTSGKVPLFLISLRAGGTGLNLTQADTVIHYDPWWNPAVENQATDRAYRIGQQNSVFVYKMVAEHSVEEKIIAMQKKKAALAEGILSGAKGEKLQFDQKDVEALFGEE